MNDNYTRYAALPDGKYVSREAWEEWGNEAQVFTKRGGQWFCNGILAVLLDRFPQDLMDRPSQVERGTRAVVEYLMETQGISREEALRMTQATIELLKKNMS